MSSHIKEFDSKLASLKSMFPDWSHDDLKELLVEYKGNAEDIVDKILSGEITQWEKLEKGSNKQPVSTSQVVRAPYTSTPSSNNFRPVPTGSNASSDSKYNNKQSFNSRYANAASSQKANVNPKGNTSQQQPTQPQTKNSGINAFNKKPAATAKQQSATPTELAPVTAAQTATKAAAAAKLQKLNGMKILTEAEIADLTWADRMTYKKKLKELTLLQAQQKEEEERLAKEKIANESPLDAKSSVYEEPTELDNSLNNQESTEENEEEQAGEDREEDKEEQVEEEAKEEDKEEQVEEEAKEEDKEEKEQGEEKLEQAEENEKEETFEKTQAKKETSIREEATKEQQDHAVPLNDYNTLKNAVDDIASQQIGTPSSQFQQPGQQQFAMGFNGYPAYPQYGQGFIPQNQMYGNNFVDPMSMYNQFVAYNYFQQQQMQQQMQQQQASGNSTAPNSAAPGESPSQPAYDFTNPQQAMMNNQYAQYMQQQNPYGYNAYGQYGQQQQPQQPPQDEQHSQQQQQQPGNAQQQPGPELTQQQQQDQYNYYQQQYYNYNQNYNQY